MTSDRATASYIGALRKEPRRTFDISRTHAWHQFVKRRLQPGERTEDLMADLIRLGGLIGAGVNDDIVRLQFIEAMPPFVRKRLERERDVESMELNNLARIGSSLLDEGDENMVDRRPQQKSKPRMKCYKCGGAHMLRECNESSLMCWVCGETGHVSKNCKTQGNTPKKAG